MDRRNVIVGVVIILAVVLFIVYIRTRPTQNPLDSIPTPSVEEKIEQSFNLEIPDDLERAELKAVTGDGSGLATRKFEDGKFELTILADLEEPQNGFYQGWLVMGSEDGGSYDVVLLGTLKVAKGGYLLEYISSSDLLNYKKVVVSKENSEDLSIEQMILEGTFQ